MCLHFIDTYIYIYIYIYISKYMTLYMSYLLITFLSIVYVLLPSLPYMFTCVY